MDSQIKSIVTTIAVSISTMIATFAATHGVINTSQQSALSDILVTVAGVAITALLGWYKARQSSQTNMIQTINAADNGVKVVAANAAAPAVNAPLKEVGR